MNENYNKDDKTRLGSEGYNEKEPSSLKEEGNDNHYKKEESIDRVGQTSTNIRQLSSALDGLSDRMNNKFDKMDVRKKGRLLLFLAVVVFIIGMIYLYNFLSQIINL